jgi:hypothetical protein
VQKEVEECQIEMITNLEKLNLKARNKGNLKKSMLLSLRGTVREVKEKNNCILNVKGEHFTVLALFYLQNIRI